MQTRRQRSRCLTSLFVVMALLFSELLSIAGTIT
jgi:hypothetical protein